MSVLYLSSSSLSPWFSLVLFVLFGLLDDGLVVGYVNLVPEVYFWGSHLSLGNRLYTLWEEIASLVLRLSLYAFVFGNLAISPKNFARKNRCCAGGPAVFCVCQSVVELWSSLPVIGLTCCLMRLQLLAYILVNTSLSIALLTNEKGL